MCFPNLEISTSVPAGTVSEKVTDLSSVFSAAVKYEGIDEDATRKLSSLSNTACTFAWFNPADANLEAFPFKIFLFNVYVLFESKLPCPLTEIDEGEVTW